MNSYAGDQAKRYAAKLPNPGVNRFAGAFSTSSGSASLSQAPGFASALQASIGSSRMTGSVTTGFRSSFTIKGSDLAAGKPFSVGMLNKPFKPPTMSGQNNQKSLPTVSTVETRLTQQNHAVILNPIRPNEPQTPAYTLPAGKDEDFSFLRGLAKDESEDYAVRMPTSAKRRPNGATPPIKRSKS